jgi:hypothetical protein
MGTHSGENNSNAYVGRGRRLDSHVFDIDIDADSRKTPHTGFCAPLIFVSKMG